MKIKNKYKALFMCLFAVVLMANKSTFQSFVKPKGWPAPVYDFQKSPLDSATMALGRYLFYDPILSADSTISCASCHLSYTAFTHVDHALSHGIHDSIGTRNSPVLVNMAWQPIFMWDGAVNHIEVQALAPISHPAEMGDDIGNVVAKLQRHPLYPKRFAKAFGDSTVTGQHVLLALAQFQLSFVSSNAKYDKVMRKEDGVVFTAQEAKGHQLFLQHCNSCHQAPLFTNHSFQNNGLPVDTLLQDVGRMGVSLISDDSLKFKVPTLRNIEFSRPYMHDGRFESLLEVLDHYEKGIQSSRTLSKKLEKGIPLSHEDKLDLFAFLLTLSDKSFLFDPELAFPRK